jgi:hypothetical protein
MADIQKLLPNIAFDKNRSDDDGQPQNLEEVEAYQALPNQSDSELASGVINNVLNFSAILVIIAVVVAAIYYLTSRGKPEGSDKAKQILLNLIIGVVIVSVAYGVVTGISKINFFPT